MWYNIRQRKEDNKNVRKKAKQIYRWIQKNNRQFVSFGKTYAELSSEYGISHSALAKWIKQYSEVKIDDETVVTAEKIKALQKRNAQLEEENLILKKAIAIFTPHSDKG